MAVIDFTDNHQDLSTDMGFQFKFICERCGDGFLSTFQTNTIGVAGSLLRSAGSFFGGVLGRAGASSYEVQRAIGGAAHDAAMKKAVQEIAPLFRKCRRCGNWMCQQGCWNPYQDMCKQCAPVSEEEETARRAEHVGREVATDLALEEERRASAKAAEVEAKCGACGAPTLGKKYCPGCGQRLASSAAAFCRSCKAKLTPGAKFCGECGEGVV
jgi:hypothetical protein